MSNQSCDTDPSVRERRAQILSWNILLSHIQSATHPPIPSLLLSTAQPTPPSRYLPIYLKATPSSLPPSQIPPSPNSKKHLTSSHPLTPPPHLTSLTPLTKRLTYPYTLNVATPAPLKPPSINPLYPLSILSILADHARDNILPEQGKLTEKRISWRRSSDYPTKKQGQWALSKIYFIFLEEVK